MIKKEEKIVEKLSKITGVKYILTAKWDKETYTKGWRYGEGNAMLVVRPGSLIEIWEILKICLEENLIIIMQAANTGLTGGSTPNGNDYDRPVIIINTLRINDIHLINNANQIIALSGSTLYDLETK